jgi:hypothetical protein
MQRFHNRVALGIEDGRFQGDEHACFHGFLSLRSGFAVLAEHSIKNRIHVSHLVGRIEA